MKTVLLLILFTFLSLKTFAQDVSDLPFVIDQIPELKYEKSDEFKTLVSSITTTDKSLFPGVGQIILHTTGVERKSNIKGLVILSPEDVPKVTYITVAKINSGRLLDIISATKLGVTLTVLKIKLLSENLKITSNRGGLLNIKIIKNALFNSFYTFQLRLSKLNGEWSGSVKRNSKFMSFKTMHLNAFFAGINSVEFR